MRLKPDEFIVYTRLAEAYVQTRQPAKAIGIAEQAARLARSAGEAAATAQIEQWLKDFRAQQERDGEKADISFPKSQVPSSGNAGESNLSSP